MAKHHLPGVQTQQKLAWQGQARGGLLGVGEGWAGRVIFPTSLSKGQRTVSLGETCTGVPTS